MIQSQCDWEYTGGRPDARVYCIKEKGHEGCHQDIDGRVYARWERQEPETPPMFLYMRENRMPEAPLTGLWTKAKRKKWWTTQENG